MYHYAVKLAFSNAKIKKENTHMVSNFQDSAFNQNLFLWDSVFISRFTQYFDLYVPGIETLNNFYAMQLEDGLIPREFHKETSEDYPKWVNDKKLPLHSYYHLNYGYRKINTPLTQPLLKFYNLGRDAKIPYYTLDNLNHPLFAYAEYAYFCFTGRRERLYIVHESLYRYYLGLKNYLEHHIGLYPTDWASMDNSPRNKDLFLGVDISSEMVLFAKSMISIYEAIDVENQDQRTHFFKDEIHRITQSIQTYMWDQNQHFFFDLDANLNQIKIKTVAGFWPLLAGITDENQKKYLCQHLKDPNTFYLKHLVPSLSKQEQGYIAHGGYWSGGVWASTNLMVTDGLEAQGEHHLAKEIALNHLNHVKETYEQTKTLWESYPSGQSGKGDSDKDKFVGWTGIAPIHYFLTYWIGLSFNALTNTLTWEINTKEKKTGCLSYPITNHPTDLVATRNGNTYQIQVKTSACFTLELKCYHTSLKHQIQGDTQIEVII